MSDFRLRGNRLYLNSRKVGWLTRVGSKRVFISPRKRHSHYMRIFKGWGLSKAVIDYLQTRDVSEIHLRVYKSVTLISSLRAWMEHGITRTFKPFEEQVFLPEKYMVSVKLTLSELLESA